jgi:hypothetical protein
MRALICREQVSSERPLPATVLPLFCASGGVVVYFVRAKWDFTKSKHRISKLSGSASATVIATGRRLLKWNVLSANENTHRKYTQDWEYLVEVLSIDDL